MVFQSSSFKSAFYWYIGLNNVFIELLKFNEVSFHGFCRSSFLIMDLPHEISRLKYNLTLWLIFPKREMGENFIEIRTVDF